MGGCILSDKQLTCYAEGQDRSDSASPRKQLTCYADACPFWSPPRPTVTERGRSAASLETVNMLTGRAQGVHCDRDPAPRATVTLSLRKTVNMSCWKTGGREAKRPSPGTGVVDPTGV